MGRALLDRPCNKQCFLLRRPMARRRFGVTPAMLAMMQFAALYSL
jgi:hypothetical protein